MLHGPPAVLGDLLMELLPHDAITRDLGRCLMQIGTDHWAYAIVRRNLAAYRCYRFGWFA